MMSGALTIARKEFTAFFKTPVAYIVLCAFLILNAFPYAGRLA